MTVIVKPFPPTYLPWLYAQLQEEYMEDDCTKGFWGNRDLIIKNLDKLYMIQAEQPEPIGFISYADDKQIVIAMLWIRKDMRRCNIGSEVEKLHCQNLVEAGHLTAQIDPVEEAQDFWQYCGYQKYSQDQETWYKDLSDIHIPKLIVFGNKLPIINNEYRNFKVKVSDEWVIKNISAIKMNELMLHLAYDGAIARRKLIWT